MTGNLKKSNKITKLTNRTLLVVLLGVLLLVGYCFFNSEISTKTRISFGEVETLDQGWTLNQETVTLPYSIKGVYGETYTIVNTLPDTISDGDALDISSNYCYTEIKIDGSVRYSYGDKQPLPFGRMIGNIKCITELSKEDAGKSIEITVAPLYTQDYQIPVVHLGTYRDITAGVLSDNMWKIVICTVLGVFVVIAMVFTAIQYMNKLKNGRNMGLHFAMFVLAAVSWIICSSDLPQLFTDANEAVSLLSYLSLAFIGAPFMAFCAEIFPSGKLYLEIMALIGCLNTAAVAILFVTGILDPPEILLSTHIYFGLLVVSDFFFSIREKNGKTFLRKCMMVNNIILLLFVALGLLMFYLHPTSGLDSVFFSLGFTLFIVILFFMLVHIQLDVTKEMAGMEMYKKLAFTDTMTKMGNRTAFDNEFERLASGEYKEKPVGTLFIFDVNNLKKINDYIGHHAGDELIIGASHCIRKIFSQYGAAYRIGGDEFAVVVLKEIDGEKTLSDLELCVTEYNKKHDQVLSIAHGYSSFVPAELNLDKMRTVFQKADEAMYQNKQEMKEVGNI